jgi:hypothetical protein
MIKVCFEDGETISQHSGMNALKALGLAYAGEHVFFKIENQADKKTLQKAMDVKVTNDLDTNQRAWGNPV